MKSTLNTITTPEWWGITLGGLFVWFKGELMAIVEIFAIWVFIFMGFRFVMARWNPEEFKKTWVHFIYSIIWIFFIFAAWWLVRLVSSLNL
jgi:NADH:ubiquinone oxidoreductase subunit 6 (subunit J)